VRVGIAILALLLATPVAAQEEADADADENPLALLKSDLVRVLAAAELPFEPEQDRAITLMMEDRLQASESLFGGLMDFRAGPTSGQQAERLQSAIGWLRNEFLSRVTDYLTPEQLAVWNGYRNPIATSGVNTAEGARAERPQQTQYVRINNNRFTAEDVDFQGGGGTFQGNFGNNNFQQQQGNQAEVIERGGAGAWHGTTQSLFKDDALNSRNVFAANKPPYQERQVNVDVGGPVIPGRLTTNVNVSYSLAQQVDTINATLPEGPFSLGIARPTVNRSINSRNTLQLADAHSLSFDARYFADEHKDEGIGGFTLRERASHRNGANFGAEVRQFSALGVGGIFEARFNMFSNRVKIVPFSDAVRIDVSDTFNSGGAQNRYEDSNRNYNFSNLYTRLGQKLTIKTGMEGAYRRNQSFSLNNFGGTFSFANLDEFLSGVADTYRVARGEPRQVTTQLELAGFIQNDVALTRQLTLMFGVRYDAQSNLGDRNNFSPRASVAYGAGRGTVIRGGWGVFYDRMEIQRVAEQRRYDGVQQYEIVIDKPLYPDPFTGSRRQAFPSVRITDPGLVMPHKFVTMVSVEKTFWRTLLVTAMYDYQDMHGRFVMRDLNQPLDTRASRPIPCALETPSEVCMRPDPTRGSVLNLTNLSFQTTHTVRLSLRHRFSIFNVTSNYVYQNRFEDNGDYGIPTNSLEPRADWSTGNQPRHGWNGSLNAQMPFGIFLTETASANTGRFYTITTGKDDNQDGTKNDRPAGVGRNSALGPKRINFDLNISKAFFMGGAGTAGTRKNVNLFANVINMFNRVHYNNPSAVMSSDKFGQYTGAADPREVEVGLRFQF
jgi:hypothetical protein